MTFPHTFRRWRPHPWHGLQVGRDPPRLVHAYIEISPFDLVKYEIDKVTGYLRVDRPQRTSSQPPALYGFIPRTYCGGKVSALCGPRSDVTRPILRTERIGAVCYNCGLAQSTVQGHKHGHENSTTSVQRDKERII